MSGADERGRPRPRRQTPERPRPREGPRTPPTLRFSPFAVGVAVFSGIAIPCVVVGYTRSTGVNGLIIAIGIAVGVTAGVIAAIWVASRDGRIWKGPQL